MNMFQGSYLMEIKMNKNHAKPIWNIEAYWNKGIKRPTFFSISCVSITVMLKILRVLYSQDIQVMIISLFL